MSFPTVRDTMRRYGTSALYITHDLAVVAQIADRLMVLRHGKEIETGATGEVLQAPKAEYTRRLVAEREGSLRPAPGGQKAGDEVLLAGEGQLGPRNHGTVRGGGEDFLVELGGEFGVFAGAAQIPRGGEAVGGHGPLVGSARGPLHGGFERQRRVLEFAETIGGPAVADQRGGIAGRLGPLAAGG